MKKKLDTLKESIRNSPKLSEEEKSSSYKIIEEWVKEDKAFGILFEKLAEISEEMKPILAELGLI